jgi:tetratricopeptide (TPR) repeat protein
MPTNRDANLKHSQYYMDLLLRADIFYEQGREGIVNGLRLFDGNWKNIEIGQKWAALKADTDDLAASMVIEYPERGARCLYLRQKPAERIMRLETALHVAHARGFELLVGILHGKMALAFTEMDRYHDAIEHYSVQLTIAEKLRDFEGMGEGACNLGILYDNLEMLEPAQVCYRYALELANKISNQKIIEVASGNLGLVYLKQAKFREAMDCFDDHLQSAEQNGDEWSEGNALTNKGIACLKLGKHEQALSCFRASILINQKLNDLVGEAKNLSYIGIVLEAKGDLYGAVLAHQAHIALAQKLSDFRAEANSNWNLGKVYIEQGKYEQGLQLLYTCIEYEKKIGDPAWEDDLRVVQTIEKAHGTA